MNLRRVHRVYREETVVEYSADGHRDFGPRAKGREAWPWGIAGLLSGLAWNLHDGFWKVLEWFKGE